MKGHGSDLKLTARTFFRLLPFQVLLIVVNAVNGIVDSLFASNAVGKAAMGAIGLYAPLNHFLYAASIMLVSGSQLLYGRYMGREPGKVKSVFTADLAVSLGISLATSALLVLGASFGAAGWFTNDAAVRPMLERYLLGQSAGIPALVMGQQLFAFLSLENRRARSMAASLGCFLSNVLFNWLFVVALDMDTLGLGLGSSAAAWVFFAIQALGYVRGRSELKVSPKDTDRGDALAIVRLGYSGAISRFVEMFRCLIVNALVLRYVGSAGLSAFAASNSVLAIVWALPFGMMAVCRMLLSISIGEDDRKGMADAMKVAVGRGFLLMCLVAGALIACAVPLTRLFYRDAADPVYGMTVMGFRLLPCCMPLAVVSLSFACYAQAAEKRALAVALPLVDGMVSVVALSAVLIPKMMMNGLYLANILNGFVCAALIAAFSAFEKRRFPRSMEDLMAIPERIGVPDGDRFDITVRAAREVTDVSQKVIGFCLGRGIDKRRAFLCGLSLEEAAGNVVEHGFEKDKKTHGVDIRVVRAKDAIVLRVRDDCVPFDPAARMRQTRGDDPAANVGIRMVYGLAKDVQYRNLLGLNVLTVRL